MEQDDMRDATARIIERTWGDAGFKERLIANPAAVLADEGVPLPDGIELRVVEDTDRVRHFVLRQRQADAELTDEMLAAVVGGAMPTPVNG